MYKYLYFQCYLFKQGTCNQINRLNERHGPSAPSFFSKLGIQILPDRQLCFGGRILKGVVFPKNGALQGIVMKRLLVWYLPCFETQDLDTTGGFYKLNNECFLQRESELLRIFRRLSGKPPLVGIGPRYFYMPLTNTWTQIEGAQERLLFYFSKNILSK